jgi:DNA-binding CsgD family transcriptional regulator
MLTSEADRERARDATVALAARELPDRDFFEQLATVIARAVPFDAGGWCSVDPATLLFTSAVTQNFPAEATQAFFENELLEPDVAKFADIARRPVPVAVLSHETGSRLRTSRRLRHIYAPAGLRHELRAAFRLGGSCWGIACLSRTPDRPDFSIQEMHAIAELGSHIAAGLRATARARATTESTQRGPGTLVLDRDGTIVSLTAEAEAWLTALSGRPPADGLAPAVHAVAARARATGRPGPPPQLRVRTLEGRWLELHASTLRPHERRSDEVAVVLAPARPSEIAPLLVEAYELSRRERDVLGLLLRGRSIPEIADRLIISPHTAGDHVKAIYTKTGVSNRTELAARLFVDHYNDRLTRPMN